MSIDDDLVAAVRDHTIGLAGPAPGGNRDGETDSDLGFLADRLDGADVVGLGEASHGSRECFGLKHWLIRLLVEQCGFRTVAFEADVAAMLAVDGFVRRGDGNAVAALDELFMWQWQTESVRALLSWLRSFNEGRPPDDRVRVRGIDLSEPAVPAAQLRSYLEDVDPTYATGARELSKIVNLEVPTDDEPARERRLDEATAAASSVADRLDERRASYVEASSEEEWRRVRHLCRVIEQTCEWHRVRHERDGPSAAGMAERDRLIAENVAWTLEQDPGDGVALWAHNSHVQRGTFDDGQRWTDSPTMGEQLDRELGDRYHPLGIEFGHGTIRALESGDTGEREPRTFSVGEPLEGSMTAHLDALGDAPFFLDLTEAMSDSRLESWLEDERRLRWIGSAYDPDAEPGTHYLRTRLPASFDGLCFVPASTPTRPLEGS